MPLDGPCPPPSRSRTPPAPIHRLERESCRASRGAPPCRVPSSLLHVLPPERHCNRNAMKRRERKRTVTAATVGGGRVGSASVGYQRPDQSVARPALRERDFGASEIVAHPVAAAPPNTGPGAASTSRCTRNTLPGPRQVVRTPNPSAAWVPGEE